MAGCSVTGRTERGKYWSWITDCYGWLIRTCSFVIALQVQQSVFISVSVYDEVVSYIIKYALGSPAIDTARRYKSGSKVHVSLVNQWSSFTISLIMKDTRVLYRRQNPTVPLW